MKKLQEYRSKPPSEDGWKMVVDFTDGGKVPGVPVEDVLKVMKRMSSEHSNTA